MDSVVLLAGGAGIQQQVFGECPPPVLYLRRSHGLLQQRWGGGEKGQEVAFWQRVREGVLEGWPVEEGI